MSLEAEFAELFSDGTGKTVVQRALQGEADILFLLRGAS
jgi:hypothetical protein